MPIVMMASKQQKELDGSLKKKAFAFLEKLNESDTAPGLHIEPIINAADGRVRTGRVDQQFRAVLFRLEQMGGEPTYVYYGTWKHDDAIQIARTAVIQSNRFGIAEVLHVEDTPESAQVGAPLAASPAMKPSLFEVKPLLFERYGYTQDDLVNRLGIDPTVANRALRARDEDDLVDKLQLAPAWQADALLDLALGVSIEDIADKLQLVPTPAPASLEITPDEAIIKAFDHPASQMQFALVEDNDELRRVLEGGDFEAWRRFLHPAQRRFAEGEWNGSYRLSGGAGTGKTVVVLHRARYLSRRNPGARVVVSTFNTVLAKGLSHDLTKLDPGMAQVDKLGVAGVLVTGLDSLAAKILNQAGDDVAQAAQAVLGAGSTGLGRPSDDSPIWDEALSAVGATLDVGLRHKSFLTSEYVSVVLAHSVTTIDQYVKAPRAGRGVRLSRGQRVAVWRVFETYRRTSRMNDVVSYPEAVAIAAEWLRQQSEQGKGHLADHVLIDEAQDLHAAHWNLLRALVAEGPDDLFIAEDSHQRIYVQPVVLSRFGIKIVGRSRKLTLNYRTTAQNLAYAMRLLKGATVTDLEQTTEDMVGYRSARTGPVPLESGCASLAAELDQAAKQIQAWIDAPQAPSTIAILTRSGPTRDFVVRALSERGVPVRALDKGQPNPDYPQVLTMHRAKGMEFACVLLWGIDDKSLPLQTVLNAEAEGDREEALLRERSLLYVAATRARDQLVVTWSGKPSTLLGGKV